MRSSQISLGPTAQQQGNWAVRKSRLQRDGQTTELKIHTYHFDDEKEPCFDLPVTSLSITLHIEILLLNDDYHSTLFL